MSPQTPTGAERIAIERKRQIEEEGWTPEHDQEHSDGALALAACCYAAPEKIYALNAKGVNQQTYYDPWPWEDRFDRRYRCGSGSKIGSNQLSDPNTYTRAERLDLLVKAGALIAAEIDRLLRLAGEP